MYASQCREAEDTPAEAPLSVAASLWLRLTRTCVCVCVLAGRRRTWKKQASKRRELRIQHVPPPRGRPAAERWRRRRRLLDALRRGSSRPLCPILS